MDIHWLIRLKTRRILRKDAEKTATIQRKDGLKIQQKTLIFAERQNCRYRKKMSKEAENRPKCQGNGSKCGKTQLELSERRFKVLLKTG